jgi:hypothetical protein
MLVIVVTATTGLAQEAVPDTTSAWRYYPLQVGNVWEYVEKHPLLPPEQKVFIRRTVVADTVIDARRYFVHESLRFRQSDGELLGSSHLFVRFDTTTARAMAWQEGGEWSLELCPFDAPFGVDLDCSGDGEVETHVYGGTDITIMIGEQQVTGVSEKSFYAIGSDAYPVPYIADIGEGSRLYGFHGSIDLVYARIGTREYGTPYVLTSEPSAESRATLELGVYPNPGLSTSGGATVAVSLLRGQRVRLEVYDLQGRRVAILHDGALPAGAHRFVTAPLAAGLYIVRASGDGIAEVARMSIAN